MKPVQKRSQRLRCFGLFSTLLLASACGSSMDPMPANLTISPVIGGIYQESESEPEQAKTIRIFGDSIFTAGGNMIAQELERLIQKPINSHAVGGTVINQIREQYRAARQWETHTVIMDGGGNDVLGARGDCQNQLSQRCRSIIENAVNIAKDLFTMMAEDGITNVVHLGCHYPMGWSGGFDAAVDYSYTLLEQACRDSGANCIIVDARQAFRGRNDLLEWDGVHPNRGGAQTFAKLIRDGIQKAGMEL